MAQASLQNDKKSLSSKQDKYIKENISEDVVDQNDKDLSTNELNTCVEIKAQSQKIQEKTKLGRITRKPSRYRDSEFDLPTKSVRFDFHKTKPTTNEASVPKEGSKKKNKTNKPNENLHKQTTESKKQESQNSTCSQTQVVPLYCSKTAGECVTFDDEGNFKFKVCPEHTIHNKSARMTSYSCDICDMLFPRSFSLRRHYERIHINPRFVKNKAKQFAENTNNNTENTTNKNGETTENESHYLYACKLCRQRVYFKEKNQLRNHHQLKHLDVVNPTRNVFNCDSCDRNYSTRHELDRHKRSHSGERPYACRICEKRFPTSTNARRHERTHTGERPHVCKVCKKNFIQKNDMVKHLLSVHKMKVTKTKAEKAGKSVASKPTLKNEEKSENAEIDKNNRFEENIDFAAYLKLDQFEQGSLMGYVNIDKTQNLKGQSNQKLNEPKAFLKPKDKSVSPKNKISKSEKALNSEEPERSFKCSDCAKSFTSNVNLKRHYRLKHERSQSLRATAPVSMVVQKYMIKDDNATNSQNEKSFNFSITNKDIHVATTLSTKQNNLVAKTVKEPNISKNKIDLAQLGADKVSLPDKKSSFDQRESRKSVDELLKIVSNSTQKWIPDKNSLLFQETKIHHESDFYEKIDLTNNDNSISSFTNNAAPVFKALTLIRKSNDPILNKSPDLGLVAQENNNNSNVLLSKERNNLTKKINTKQGGKLNKILERLSNKKESKDVSSSKFSIQNFSRNRFHSNLEPNDQVLVDGNRKMISPREIIPMEIPPFQKQSDNQEKRMGTVLHRNASKFPSKEFQNQNLQQHNSYKYSQRPFNSYSSKQFRKKTYPYNSMNHNLQTSSRNKADRFNYLNSGSAAMYSNQHAEPSISSYSKYPLKIPSYNLGDKRQGSSRRGSFSQERNHREFMKPRFSSNSGGSFLDRCWNSKMNSVACNRNHPCGHCQLSSRPENHRPKVSLGRNSRNLNRSNRNDFSSNSNFHNRPHHCFKPRIQAQSILHSEIRPNFRQNAQVNTIYAQKEFATAFKESKLPTLTKSTCDNEMPLDLTKSSKKEDDYVVTKDGVLDFSKKKPTENLSDTALDSKKIDHCNVKPIKPFVDKQSLRKENQSKPFRFHDIKFDNTQSSNSTLKFHNVEFNNGKQVLGQCGGGRPTKQLNTFHEFSYSDKYADEKLSDINMPWNSQMETRYVKEQFSPYFNPTHIRPRSLSGDDFVPMVSKSFEPKVQPQNSSEYSQSRFQHYRLNSPNKYNSPYPKKSPPKYRLPTKDLMYSNKHYQPHSSNLYRPGSSKTNDFYLQNKQDLTNPAPSFFHDRFTELNLQNKKQADYQKYNHKFGNDFLSQTKLKPLSDIIKANLDILKRKEKFTEEPCYSDQKTKKNITDQDVMQRCIEKAKSELEHRRGRSFSAGNEKLNIQDQCTSFGLPIYNTISSKGQLKTKANEKVDSVCDVAASYILKTKDVGSLIENNQFAFSSRADEISTSNFELQRSKLTMTPGFETTGEDSSKEEEEFKSLNEPELEQDNDVILIETSPMQNISFFKVADKEVQCVKEKLSPPPLLDLEENLFLSDSPISQDLALQKESENSSPKVIEEMSTKSPPTKSQIEQKKSLKNVSSDKSEIKTISVKKSSKTNKQFAETSSDVTIEESTGLTNNDQCKILDCENKDEDKIEKDNPNTDYPAVFTALKETNLSTESDDILKETDLSFEKDLTTLTKPNPKKGEIVDNIISKEPKSFLKAAEKSKISCKKENVSPKREEPKKLVKKLKLIAVKSKEKGVAKMEWTVREIPKTNENKDLHFCNHCHISVKGKSMYKKHVSRCSLVERYSLRKRKSDNQKEKKLPTVAKKVRKLENKKPKGRKTVEIPKSDWSDFTWILKISDIKKAVAVVKLADELPEHSEVKPDSQKSKNSKNDLKNEDDNNPKSSNFDMHPQIREQHYLLTKIKNHSLDDDKQISNYYPFAANRLIGKSLKPEKVDNSLQHFSDTYDVYLEFDESIERRTEIVEEPNNLPVTNVGKLNTGISSVTPKKLNLNDIDTYFCKKTSHDHTYDLTDFNLRKQLERHNLLESFQATERKKRNRSSLNGKVLLSGRFKVKNNLLKTNQLKSLRNGSKMKSKILPSTTKQGEISIKKGAILKKRRSIRVYSKKNLLQVVKNPNHNSSESEE